MLFNRLLEPDIDLAAMKLTDRLELSETEEMRVPMLWIAMLSGRIKASLAASAGVSDVGGVVKYLLAGADAVMTTSALLRHGVGYMSTLVDGLRAWMEEREIASLADMRGMMSLLRSRDRSAYSRANYIRDSWTLRDAMTTRPTALRDFGNRRGPTGWTAPVSGVFASNRSRWLTVVRRGIPTPIGVASSCICYRW